MIDIFQAGRLHRTLREKSLNKQAYQPHIPHTVMKNETYDPSLTQKFVYHDRENWYSSAGICGFCDVDLPIEKGEKRFLTETEIITTANKKNKGLNLYE